MDKTGVRREDELLRAAGQRLGVQKQVAVGQADRPARAVAEDAERLQLVIVAAEVGGKRHLCGLSKLGILHIAFFQRRHQAGVEIVDVARFGVVVEAVVEIGGARLVAPHDKISLAGLRREKLPVDIILQHTVLKQRVEIADEPDRVGREGGLLPRLVQLAQRKPVGVVAHDVRCEGCVQLRLNGGLPFVEVDRLIRHDKRIAVQGERLGGAVREVRDVQENLAVQFAGAPDRVIVPDVRILPFLAVLGQIGGKLFGRLGNININRVGIHGHCAAVGRVVCNVILCVIGEDVELVAVLVADDELKVLIIQRDRLPDGVVREEAARIQLVIVP